MNLHGNINSKNFKNNKIYGVLKQREPAYQRANN
jgi:hypothetical protein